MKLGVLVPHQPGEPGPPEDLPIGRAALQLAAEGIALVFGGRASDGVLHGHIARPGRWEPAASGVTAAFDRFNSQTDPAGHAALIDALGGTPVFNTDAFVRLCRDKIATQHALGDLPQPEIQTDPTRFAAALEGWGSAYLKPRFGAFGRGVRRVLPGDPLPSRGPGAVPGREEPLFLQRAVDPVAGWRGVTCRILCQRTPTDWWVGPPVARRSRTDWVVNAARGSDVVPLSAFLPQAVDAVRALTLAAAQRLDRTPAGEGLVEVGVDVALDASLQPWILEVNSRPRGRLEALAGADAETYRAAHVEACCRPLRTLAARYG